VTPLGDSGPLLGQSAQCVFPEPTQNTLDASDLIFLYSDGLVEARGEGERTFDRKDFRKLIRQLPTQAPNGFLRDLLKARRAKLGTPIPDDDVTALSFRVQTSPRAPT
jgi:serine phosphatase RsbU (regulator of sigma subunit)